MPPSTAARLLADLVDAGIVLAEPIGGALAYRMNTDHLTSRAISRLASVRFDLIREIKEEIKTWETPAVAGWLFGSTARGDGDRQSDVDLLLVAPDDELNHRWNARSADSPIWLNGGPATTHR